MTARAGAILPRLRGNFARLASAFGGCASVILSNPAHAQLGVMASAFTDYRFRGVSLSGGRPVGILDASYEFGNGFYSDASGRAVFDEDDGPKLLGFSVSGGYAARLGPTLSADVGVVHSGYSQYSHLGSERSYTEFYAGIAGKNIGTRVAISPDYLGSARRTLYAEIYGHIDLSPRTTIEAQIGALTPLEGGYRHDAQEQFDGQIGIAHRIGRLTLRASLTGRSQNYLYVSHPGRRTALVAGVSSVF